MFIQFLNIYRMYTTRYCSEMSHRRIGAQGRAHQSKDRIENAQRTRRDEAATRAPSWLSLRVHNSTRCGRNGPICTLYQLIVDQIAAVNAHGHPVGLTMTVKFSACWVINLDSLTIKNCMPSGCAMVKWITVFGSIWFLWRGNNYSNLYKIASSW